MTTMKDLVLLDEDSKLLEFTFSRTEKCQIHIWPFIRSFLFASIFDSEKNFAPAHSRNQKFNPKRFLTYVFLSFVRNPKRISHSKVLIFSSSVRNEKFGDTYWNSLSDPWADVLQPDVSIVESATRQTFDRPRYKSERVFFQDWIILKSAIRKKIFFVFRKMQKNETDFIEYLIIKLREMGISLSSVQVEYIQQLLKTFSSYADYQYSHHYKILKKIKPKLIFVEDGFYGGRHASLLAAANDLGIISAEMQHGFVGVNHVAYNFSKKMNVESYKRYCPRYFLVFGDYWKKNINPIAEVVVIGNAQLQMEANARLETLKKERIILVISDSIIPEITQNITLAIHSKFYNKFKVLLRPHPGEKTVIKDRYSKLLSTNIGIDDSPLYESLSKAEIVVGCGSTVLYEALAFQCRVAVWDTELTHLANMPSDIFKYIQNESQLHEWIYKKTADIRRMKIEEVWEPNWKSKFNTFVDSFI